MKEIEATHSCGHTFTYRARDEDEFPPDFIGLCKQHRCGDCLAADGVQMAVYVSPLTGTEDEVKAASALREAFLKENVTIEPALQTASQEGRVRAALMYKHLEVLGKDSEEFHTRTAQLYMVKITQLRVEWMEKHLSASFWLKPRLSGELQRTFAWEYGDKILTAILDAIELLCPEVATEGHSVAPAAHKAVKNPLHAPNKLN